MNCTQFRALLTDHHGNELLLEVKSQFETHRVECAHCSFMLESFVHTVKLTRLLPKKPLPPGVEDRLRAAVAKAAAE